ncbi:hypothetical protein [Xylella fastidiosa]|uniref:hypothetical protein n=1 Tax=Xylella fastidiosa TaxID=2371 RepID=UPI001F1F8A5A|nr:hypothetical protein [Xylella fastidiosa]
MATLRRTFKGCLRHRAYSGITGVYAKYRRDYYMVDVVGAIDAYMGQLRASQ